MTFKIKDGLLVGSNTMINANSDVIGQTYNYSNEGASVRPTLNLDFANGRVVDPRFNFTRSTTATYRDKRGLVATANINQPRFDYGANGEPLGILIEDTATNLVIQSVNPANTTAWTRTRLTTVAANAAIAPDGTLTAVKVVPDAQNNLHHLSSTTFAITANKTYTWSVWAKQIDTLYKYLRLRAGDNIAFINDIIIDTSTGSIVGSRPTGSVEAYNDGWTRMSITANTNPTATNATLQVWVYGTAANGSGTDVSTGDTTSGILIWGPQVESGNSTTTQSSMTSYIPTTTAAVTKSAEFLNISSVGTSPWFYNNEGSIYAETRVFETQKVQLIWAFRYDTSISTENIRGIRQFVQTGNTFGSVRDTVNPNSFFASTAIAPNNYVKSVLTFKVSNTTVGNSVYIVNGSVAGSSGDTVPQLGSNAFLILGSRELGTTDSSMSGHIKTLRVYEKQLSNSEAQVMTS